MKTRTVLFSSMLVFGLIMAACAPTPATEAAQPPAPAEPATAAPAQPAAPAAASPTAEAPAAAPAAPAHATTPGSLPEGKGIVVGDHSTISSSSPARALVGDRFSLGKFERPYNANTQDKYFPFLDIASGNFYPEADWVYARITLVGTDEASGGFPAKYAIEIDSDIDGRGDLLLIVDHPSSADWTTDGVQVLEDRNNDVGGALFLNADAEGKGDGFETVVFGQGQGQDPDLAWARLSPNDPNSIEMAFKPSVLNGDDTYLAGLWAGTASLDPALFDINDHFTHEAAGEANEEYAAFYPIKAVAELDNTCRAAVGFTQAGNEPAVCPQS